jgi:hypothetical protein
VEFCLNMDIFISALPFSFHECNMLRYFCVCFLCYSLFIYRRFPSWIVRFRIGSCSTNMTSYFEMLTKFDGENRLLILCAKLSFNETPPNRYAFRLGNTHSLVAKWVIYPDCSFFLSFFIVAPCTLMIH